MKNSALSRDIHDMNLTWFVLKKRYTRHQNFIEGSQMLNKRVLTILLIASLPLVGCTSSDKQNIKDGFTEIGHATRDATRATGHFFRDTTKDAIHNAKEATK